jgi:hypothetical protein
MRWAPEATGGGAVYLFPMASGVEGWTEYCTFTFRGRQDCRLFDSESRRGGP